MSEGVSGIPPVVLGEPGEPGKPGAPPPTAKGGDGGTGGAGGVGLPGKRGQHGDVGKRGPQGFDGRDASRASNWLIRLAVVMFLGVVILALIVTLTGQRTLDRVRTRLVQIEDAATEISDARATEQLIDDCRNLYLEDVEFAQIARDIEEGNLFSIVVLIPADATPAERLAISRGAVADLNRSDAQLRSASQAFAGYIAIDPPPIDCPHPESP